MTKPRAMVQLDNKGFSLLEILIAMALVSLILFIATGNSFSSRRNLDELLSNLERITRFSSDEATLKNQFIRLVVDLDSEKQSISLEYSDDVNLVIDTTPLPEDKEEAEEIQKKQNQSFAPVAEFEDSDIEIPLGTRIVGVGTNLLQSFQVDGKAYIYFYPTGEKDSAIIITATDDEIASLSIEPFDRVIKREYFPFDDSINYENFIEATIEKANGIYKEWLEK